MAGDHLGRRLKVQRRCATRNLGSGIPPVAMMLAIGVSRADGPPDQKTAGRGFTVN